jgi:hypothetical protein
MALQGNLRDFSATEILQLLGSQKKTGCLTLEWNTERALVFVVEGRIVSTRPPGMTKDDPLLSFLLQVNRLSDEQHRGIQTIQRESNRDLEDLLLNGRYLERDELVGYVERQILADLTRVVRWENGSYRFDPNARWPNPPLVRLSIEGALIEAARRVDEQKRFVTVFRDPYQLLGVRDLPDPNDPLSEEERELFGIIDGTRTVEEVVRSASLSEYEAYESLHRMLEANWIEVVGRKDPGLLPSSAPTVVGGVGGPPRRWFRELVMAVALLGTVAGLRFASHVVDPANRVPPEGDVFAVSQMRDLRFALELYRRERGLYPHHIDALVEGGWIEPGQARFAGYNLRYRVDPAAGTYSLDLAPGR